MDTVRTAPTPAGCRLPTRPFWQHVRIPRAVVPFAIAAAALAAAPLEAQRASSVLVGTVTDARGQPLPSAQVVVVGTRLTTMAEQAGRFRLDDVPVGVQTIEVVHVGYRTVSLALEMVEGEAVRFDVRLDLDPVDLDAVDVHALRTMPAHIRAFYERRSRGNGHFFTREQIGTMRARDVTDVLRRVPGAAIRNVSGPQGTSQSVQMGRTTGISGARSCEAAFYMNGMPFPVRSDVGINSFVRPHEIEGIEVYSGASRVPSQFSASTHNTRCGVVVIWTRGGQMHDRLAQ